ncbi:hypothetical protein Dcar01_03227 [Deinococcus carri]|uniref:Uncharacterized protein n=1 Tax=Deinococcus carri TaxID=1211323 RepID=A0ABP9WAV1_9DEIO
MDVGLASLFVAIVLGIITFPSINRYIKRKSLPSSLRVQFHEQLPIATTEDEGILLDYSPQLPLTHYASNSLIINRINSISVTMENTSEVGTLEIANYFVIKILKRVKLPNMVAEFVKPKDGIGGGGNPKFYEGIITRNDDTAYAISAGANFKLLPYLSGEEISIGKPEYSHITLTPNEVEEIIVWINFEQGYYYEFSIGIPYKASGENRMLWSDIFRTALPERSYLLKPPGIIRYEEDYEYGDIPPDYSLHAPIPYENQSYYSDSEGEDSHKRRKAAKLAIDSLISSRFKVLDNYSGYKDLYNVTPDRFLISQHKNTERAYEDHHLP